MSTHDDLPAGSTGICHASTSAIDEAARFLAIAEPDARPRPLVPAPYARRSASALSSRAKPFANRTRSGLEPHDSKQIRLGRACRFSQALKTPLASSARHENSVIYIARNLAVHTDQRDARGKPGARKRASRARCRMPVL